MKKIPTVSTKLVNKTITSIKSQWCPKWKKKGAVIIFANR